MNSYTTSHFRKLYKALPRQIRRAAAIAYRQWKENAAHPGLRFKELEGHPGTWTARINDDYRAICKKLPDGWLWWGIGDHGYFDRRF